MSAGASGTALRIGIVGAGISGLSAARTIAEVFPPPAAALTVFEWGRGPGGRTARRRATAGELSLGFEHAAPFFDVAPGDAAGAAMVSPIGSVQVAIAVSWPSTLRFHYHHRGNAS